ncbi:hypothetical protein [Erythrobacter sp. F6033]|uniref:hypothetical protein n=1 Tax=Erythrobacter sp. F6033 TaxID=2926401 RepID=UPI001FF59B68|nr:hypothetical protein [Erythrobacter sp. F6033]MCK0129133.1 hypothetical protein [Erythrobacter sp. F6033]
MNAFGGTTRRGGPIAMLVLVLAVWGSARVMTWENPFPTLLELAGAETLIAENAGSPTQTDSPNAITAVANADTRSRAGQTFPKKGMSPLFSVLTTATTVPFDKDRPLTTFQHQVLWSHTMRSRLPYTQNASYMRDRPMRLRGVTPLSQPEGDPKNLDRLSFDAWGFWRQGSGSTAVSQGRVPIYGASQIGANLQYRVAPSSQHDPRIYARAYRAMIANGETEFAVGASAKPLGSIPVRVGAELRVTETRFATNIRPSVLATTELAPQVLPADFKLEAYGGAGYVGGAGATAFVDGQAAITREIASFGGPSNTSARLSLGAAAWGGAQIDASRVDAGPTMRLDLTVGDVPARLAVDWRERVGGDASPGSGIAATLSTRF